MKRIYQADMPQQMGLLLHSMMGRGGVYSGFGELMTLAKQCRQNQTGSNRKNVIAIAGIQPVEGNTKAYLQQ